MTKLEGEVSLPWHNFLFQEWKGNDVSSTETSFLKTWLSYLSLRFPNSFFLILLFFSSIHFLFSTLSPFPYIVLCSFNLFSNFHSSFSLPSLSSLLKLYSLYFSIFSSSLLILFLILTQLSLQLVSLGFSIFPSLSLN